MKLKELAKKNPEYSELHKLAKQQKKEEVMAMAEYGSIVEWILLEQERIEAIWS